VVILTALTALGPSAAAAGANSRGEEALDRALDRIVRARGGPPGVSVLIQRGGRKEFLTYLGRDVAVSPINGRLTPDDLLSRRAKAFAVFDAVESKARNR
jgi:hypothetical protein